MKIMTRLIRSSLVVLLMFAGTTTNAQSTGSLFSIREIRCEQEQNPIGIDTPTPRFSWKINAQQRGFTQKSYRIIVSDSRSKIDKGEGNLWDSKEVGSSSSLLIPYGGKPLEATKTYYWRVRIQGNEAGAVKASSWSEVGSFRMGLFSQKDWSGAEWIALQADNKSLISTEGGHTLERSKDYVGKPDPYRMPMLRKTFAVTKPVERATVFICGLGQFDLYLNGEKVGDHFMDPVWTKYDRNAQYVGFDVTEQLSSDNNVIGVMLGNGFFNIPQDRYTKFTASYGAPKMIAKMVIEYRDGTSSVIVSDSTWKATESPVTFSSIFGGEDYDANLAKEGWSTPDFNDSEWKAAVVEPFATTLTAQRATPLKIMERIPTVRLFQNHTGGWVYDLGQNASGIIRIKVRSTGGQTVRFHPAELINADSTVDQKASGYPFYYTYTTKRGNDGKVEIWQPQFTYYGFRYVGIEGAVPAGAPNPDNLPEIVEITGLHTRNSADEVGTFHCSDPLFNKVHTLIDWAIRSNLASVLTDCPHREKLGWLEQAYLMGPSIQYRYDLSRLYAKTTEDMRVAQNPDGMIPTIAPQLVLFNGGFRDTPEWGSAYIIVPWYMYKWYGDRSLLERNYASMARYIEYLGTKAENHIISYGLGDWYDIGPGFPGYAQLTTNGVTATATYFHNVKIMHEVAKLLGKSADASNYAKLATEIRKAYNQTYFNPETRQYDRNSQTANAITLYMGLEEPENHEVVLENLIGDIQSRNNALTAGDVGYRYVLKALEQNGASDVIYDMNSRYDVPGYGFQLALGATCLTESWQAYAGVSNNHCMLGHLMEWLYSGLAGIGQTDGSIAYQEVKIRPQIVGNIREVKAAFESPYGTIRSEWKDSEREFRQKVEVPANATALVYLPTNDPKTITENGLPIEQANCVKLRADQNEEGYTIVEVGSGAYDFKVTK